MLSIDESAILAQMHEAVTSGKRIIITREIGDPAAWLAAAERHRAADPGSFGKLSVSLAGDKLVLDPT